MKYFLLLLSLIFLLACDRSQQPMSNANSTASQPMRAEKLQNSTSHTTENQTPKPADANSSTGGKWSQSGEPIDTAKFDAAIAEAEKKLKAKPNDEPAKKNLVQAYFDRGFALTEARQYASALGDYRRALKLDPNHEESKKWIGIIVGIYVNSVKKDPPNEGKEPPPLPFNK